MSSIKIEGTGMIFHKCILIDIYLFRSGIYQSDCSFVTFRNVIMHDSNFLGCNFQNARLNLLPHGGYNNYCVWFKNCDLRNAFFIFGDGNIETILDIVGHGHNSPDKFFIDDKSNLSSTKFLVASPKHQELLLHLLSLSHVKGWNKAKVMVSR